MSIGFVWNAQISPVRKENGIATLLKTFVALMLAVFLPAIALADAPQIAIDDNLPSGIAVRGMIRVVGFAQTPNSGGSVKVDLNRGQTTVFSSMAAYPTYRPDVPNSGYILDIDTDPYPNGSYTVVVTSFNGGNVVAQTSRDIRIVRFDHLGYFESPGDAQVVSGNVLEATGWALAENGFNDLTLYAHGQPVAGADWRVAARPDVYAAFPDYNERSAAFSVRANTTNLPQGPTVLTLWGTSGTGNLRPIATREVFINHDINAQGLVEYPQPMQVVDGTNEIVVRGWISSQSAPSKIRLFLNERLLAESSSFGDRPDVLGAFPSRSYAKSFAIAIPEIHLIPGTHSVRIEVVDSAGKTLTLPATNGRVPQFSVATARRSLGAHLRPTNDYTAAITQFASEAGISPSIVMYFQGFLDSSQQQTTFNTWPYLPRLVRDKGAIPMVTWETLTAGQPINDPAYSLDAVNSGQFDTFIRGYARQIRDFGTTVLIRFNHEFNGDYYAWAGGAGMGNTPAKYIQLWRHIVTLFREEGALNARFVWAPNYAAPTAVTAPANDFRNYYPGDAYVDFIGVSAYNWGNDPVRGNGWTQPATLLDNFMNSAARSYPTKPVIIAEIGTSPSYGSYSASNWIRDVFQRLPSYTNLKSVVWFNDLAYEAPDGMDFRVTNTPGIGPVDASRTSAFRTYGNSWASSLNGSGN